MVPYIIPINGIYVYVYIGTLYNPLKGCVYIYIPFKGIRWGTYICIYVYIHRYIYIYRIGTL